MKEEIKATKRSAKKNVYVYVGRGYSYGGWGGYCTVTVAEGEKATPVWWNKKMTVLERYVNIHEGEGTDRSEFAQLIREIKKNHPGAVVVH